MTDTVISASPVGDRAVVKFFYLGDRVYNASVTYTPFTPIIAETIKDRKDYWLVGFNMSQTPDRSFYAVLRYPHGKPLEPHSTRDDFEMQVLTCFSGMTAKPAAEADAASEAPPTEMASSSKKGKKHSKVKATPVTIPGETIDTAMGDAPDEPFCYRDSLTEVQAEATKMLQSPSLRLGEATDDKATQGNAEVSPWIRLSITAQ